MAYFMNLIWPLLLPSLAWTSSVPHRDLILPGLNNSNSLDVSCKPTSSPPVNYASCYNAWHKMLDDIPEGNLHFVYRHIRASPDTL